MKRFKQTEANKTIDLAIHVESFVSILNKKLDKCEITIEEFFARKKSMDALIEKNIELVNKWTKEIKE